MKSSSAYHYSEEDKRYEETLRPKSFDEFVGQAKTVKNLKVAIQAARKRGEPLDHILFSGLPGLGKTTLARLIALEMRANFHQTSGPVLKRPGDIAGLLTKLEYRDILFIDEMHRMNVEVEEFLYSAMEDFFIHITLESGIHGRTVNLPLKRFTLIGATTREGLLSDPFRSRFGILEKLGFYSIEELRRIILRSADILEVRLDTPSATIIATRSRGTPRIANRYLRRIRDLAQVKSNNVITTKIALEGLNMLGIDEHGLDETDRKILQTLVASQGGPVGIKTISVAVSEEEDTIEEVYEPYLIQQNFIHKTPRGRKATEKAFKHLKLADFPQRSLFQDK
jgi:Holliday junction DNA helicase RuvB